MPSEQTAPRPGPRRILQVAYYDNLLRTRAAMLQRAGYTVFSLLRNDEVKASARDLISSVDLVMMVGFSGTYAERAAITRWLKQEFPQVPVIALQSNSSERFPDADCSTLSEDPEEWLNAVARSLERFSSRS